MEIREEVKKVKLSAPLLAGMPEEKRNQALASVAEALMAHKDEIFAATAADMEQAKEEGIQYVFDDDEYYDDYNEDDNYDEYSDEYEDSYEEDSYEEDSYNEASDADLDA